MLFRSNLLLELHITAKLILLLVVSSENTNKSSCGTLLELQKYQIQWLNRLRNLETFGSVEREGVSETIGPKLPSLEFLFLSWSRLYVPTVPCGPAEQLRATVVTTLFICLAIGFFFPAIFFKSSSEHVCKNSLLLSVL